MGEGRPTEALETRFFRLARKPILYLGINHAEPRGGVSRPAGLCQVPEGRPARQSLDRPCIWVMLASDRGTRASFESPAVSGSVTISSFASEVILIVDTVSTAHCAAGLSCVGSFPRVYPAAR